MKIAILSREAKNYTTSRLREAATKRGHKIRIFDSMKFGMFLEEEHPNLMYANKEIGSWDAVIPRIGASVSFYGTAVVRQFEQMGVFSLNSSHGISVSRDKLRSLQVFSRHDIGIPATAFVRQKNDILPAIERVGGAPVIIKLLEGTQGMGVILADTTNVAEAIVQTLQSAKQNILLQKFVAESKGKDVRAFVIGGRVVAAMRRVAQGQEFRSNVHRGGKTEVVQLDEEYERTAVKAAHIMGLNVAGVDMLEGEDGPMVMEVNSSPGLEGIERVAGLDIAEQIIEFIEEHTRFEDLDFRQRLTLHQGYTVAEVPISKKSEFVGKSISEVGFGGMEIQILSINRQGLTLPIPNGDTHILAGDSLLCYGKKIALKNLLPEKKPRRKKKKTAKKKSTSK